MIQVEGIFVPNNEQYTVRRLTTVRDYADTYCEPFLSHVVALPRRRRALDVGANIGLWARALTKLFDSVEAFEPQAAARECLARNAPAATVHALALGATNGFIRIRNKPVHSGDLTTVKGHVVPTTKLDPKRTPMNTVDSLGFEDVDFLKIDCEGYDHFVLLGAARTLELCRPLVLFESKKQVSRDRYGIAPDAPNRFLEERGYACALEVNGNFLYAPGA